MAFTTDNIAIERLGTHYKIPLSQVISLFPINNTLTSTSTTEALSAAQGKVLGDKIKSIQPVSGSVISPYDDDNPIGVVVDGISFINPQGNNLSIPPNLTSASMLASGFIPASDIAVEIYTKDGPLSGIVENGAKLGIDRVNGDIYHPQAGVWSLLLAPESYTSSGGIKIDGLNISIDISALQTA